MLCLAEGEEGERSQGEGRCGLCGEPRGWQERAAAGERIRLARAGTFSCTLGNAVEGTPVPRKLLGSFLPRSPFIAVSSRLVFHSPKLQLQEKRKGGFLRRCFIHVVSVTEERPDGAIFKSLPARWFYDIRSCRLGLRSRSHPDRCACCGMVPLTRPCQTLAVQAAGEDLGRRVRVTTPRRSRVFSASQREQSSRRVKNFPGLSVISQSRWALSCTKAAPLLPSTSPAGGFFRTKLLHLQTRFAA